VTRGKRGSALVAVLLLLALMMTVVLAYAVLVRLEARIAGARADRGWTDAALNRAISEALAEVHGAYAFRPYVTESQTLAWVSSGGGGPVSGLVSEVTAERLGWPEPLRGTGEVSLLKRAQAAKWVAVSESNEALSVRYAWVAVNLTGLLDPMGVGALETDAVGVPSHSVMDREFLFAEEFGEAFPLAEPLFMPGGYSRDRGWYDREKGDWRVGVPVGEDVLSPDPTQWTPAEVEAVFARMYPDRDAMALAEGFMDFREGKWTPSNPDGITAVPVPMFNEVHAEMRVAMAGDMVEVEPTLEVEVWYPFPGNVQTNRFRVAKTAPLRADNAASAPAAISAQASDEKWEFEPTVAPAVLRAAFTPVTFSLPTGQVLEVSWELGGLEVERVGDGAVVDRLPAGLKLSMPAVSLPPSGGVARVRATLEAVDPRHNHRSDVWRSAATNSLGEVNLAARERVKPEADGVSTRYDELSCWTPAGREEEWGEGWIGHFPLDEPWRSVDLFGEDGRWWLRHTRAPGWEAGIWTRSRVNPNTRFPRALATVFTGVPLEAWPGQPTARVLDWEEAVLLSENLVASVELEEGAETRGGWTRGLEVGAMEVAGGRHAAEAVVAGTLDRLSVGSAVWGVVVIAEVRDPGGVVRSRGRERVVYWLDPFPDAEGRYFTTVLLRSSLPKN